jgi:hypothetical protein
MPLQDFTHPPPPKPIPGNAVTSLRTIINFMNLEQARRRAGQPALRPLDEGMATVYAVGCR